MITVPKNSRLLIRKLIFGIDSVFLYGRFIFSFRLRWIFWRWIGILSFLFLFVNNTSQINSSNLSQFISEENLRKEGVHFKRDPYSLSFSIVYNKKTYYFYEGNSYFIYSNKINNLKTPPIIQNDKIWLPRDFVSRQLKISNKENLSTPQKIKQNYSSNRLDFIVIDPGHGGRDPGTLNHKYREKDITLKTGKYLYSYLEKKFPNTRIYITRYNDHYLSLEQRASIANRKITPGKFGIFISIHCNASFISNVHGFEVYYLDQNPSNEESREVMLRENGFADGSGYVKKLESVLINTQIQSESKMLARQINRSLLASMQGLSRGRGIRKADFAVLRGALMPSVLIEIGYLSNPHEARLMNQKRYRQRLAEGIEKGIRRFLNNRPGV